MRTTRMRLVPSTVELVRAEIDDHVAFGTLLGARMPAGWPPGEAADALPWFLRQLEEGGPDASGWYGFYGIVVEGEPGAPVLVGGGGCLGPPDAGGEVEIGCSLMDAYQRRGYATEMMTAVVEWIAGDQRVTRIVAETDEANAPSQRLLGRLGLQPVGTGREPNSLRFARDIGPSRSYARAMSDFLADTTDLLRRTPDVLRALLGGIDDSWTSTPDTADGWRPRDVVGHLITGERTNYLQRAQRIVEDGTSKPFDGFDRFEMLERDKGRTLDELLDEFATRRAENLVTLERLVAGADLDKRGLHPALGEVTLSELLATWSVHDLDHIAQVYAGMAGSRDAAVGPWKQYLGILLRREDPSAVPG